MEAYYFLYVCAILSNVLREGGLIVDFFQQKI